MELKQWLGLGGLGFAALVLAFAINEPRNLFAREGVEPPSLQALDQGADGPPDVAPGAAEYRGGQAEQDEAGNEGARTESPSPQPGAPEKPDRGERPRPSKPEAADDAPSGGKEDTAPQHETAPSSDEPEAIAREPEETAVPSGQEAGGQGGQEKGAAKPASGPEGRWIRGVVKWSGKPRRPRKLDMSSDQYCKSLSEKQPNYEEDYVIGPDGGLRDVVVYVKKPPEKDYKIPQEEIVVKQEGCRYEPHVVAFMAGQTVKIRNSDNTTHNVNFVTRLNDDFNKSQNSKGQVDEFTSHFKRQEIGRAALKCDIHSWMECRVHVFEHPYFAVSKADGTFAINAEGLPDGEYELEAYHPKQRDRYSEGTVKVTLTDKGADATFTYGERRRRRRR